MKHKDIILKLINKESFQHDTRSAADLDRYQNSPLVEQAAETYQVLKDHYQLSADELAVLHQLTGVDPFILSLRQTKTHTNDTIYAHKSDVDLPGIARAAKKAELLAQLDAEIAQRNIYNTGAFRIRKKADLSDQKARLDGYMPNFDVDGGDVNNHTVLFDVYLETLQTKIDAYNALNADREAKNWFKRLFIAKKDTSSLEAAKSFVQYHRDARQDLVHPSQRLHQESRVSRQRHLNLSHEKMPFTLAFDQVKWFARRTVNKLLKAFGKKQSQSEHKLNAIHLDVEAIAHDLQVNGGKVVANIAQKDGRNPGVIQLFKLTTPAQSIIDNSFKKTSGFPSRLKTETSKIISCIDILGELQAITDATELRVLALAAGKTVDLGAAKTAILGQNLVNVEKIDQYIAALILNAPEDAEVHAAVVDLQALRQTYELLNQRAQLGENDVVFTVLKNKLNDVMLKVSSLKVRQVINMQDVPEYFDIANAVWPTYTLGEMKKQATELMQINPLRAAKNDALLEPKPGYDRDKFANELLSMCRRYVTLNDAVELQNTDAPAVADDAARALQINALAEIMKANRIACRADYFGFINHGKDQKHDYAGYKHPNDTMGNAVDVARAQFVNTLKISALKQRNYLDVMLKNLEHSSARVQQDEAYAGQFTALIDELVPNGAGQNETAAARCAQLIKQFKEERAQLNDLLYTCREVKQAVKMVAGQASYRMSPI